MLPPGCLWPKADWRLPAIGVPETDVHVPMLKWQITSETDHRDEIAQW